MVKRLLILLVTALFCPLFGVAQQDSHFSQGIFNQGYINPGSYGVNNDELFNVTVVHRIQTKSFDGAPTTTVLNINGPIESISSGVSLTFFNDKIGYLKTPGFNVGYSYIFNMSAGKLGAGISVGMINSKFDVDSWRLPDGTTGDVALPDQSMNTTS